MKAALWSLIMGAVLAMAAASIYAHAVCKEWKYIMHVPCYIYGRSLKCGQEVCIKK
jgi:hypothetical protein